MPHHDSPLKRIHWHPFRNAGTETIPAFGVMRITGIENRNGVATYTVDKPSATFQRLYLINGPKQVAAASIGSGTFDVTYALCSSSASPAYSESWGAKDSEWKLFQHRPGFFIMGGYTGDGDAQRAVVRQQEVLQLRGVLDDDLDEGDSATMSIYFRDSGTWTDSTMNQVVYDDLLETAGTLPSTSVVIARFYGDKWWVQEARCA